MRNLRNLIRSILGLIDRNPLRQGRRAVKSRLIEQGVDYAGVLWETVGKDVYLKAAELSGKGEEFDVLFIVERIPGDPIYSTPPDWEYVPGYQHTPPLELTGHGPEREEITITGLRQTKVSGTDVSAYHPTRECSHRKPPGAAQS